MEKGVFWLPFIMFYTAKIIYIISSISKCLRNIIFDYKAEFQITELVKTSKSNLKLKQDESWKVFERFYGLSTPTIHPIRINHCFYLQVADLWHVDEFSHFRSAHELNRLINMHSVECDRLKDGVILPYLHQRPSSFTFTNLPLPYIRVRLMIAW